MLFIRCGTFGLMLSGQCRPWWDTAGRSAAFIWRANDWSAAQPINPSRSVNWWSYPPPPNLHLHLYLSFSLTLPYSNSEPPLRHHLQCLSQHRPFLASLNMHTSSSWFVLAYFLTAKLSAPFLIHSSTLKSLLLKLIRRSVPPPPTLSKHFSFLRYFIIY